MSVIIKNRRSQSQIITAVLLILIVIALAVIILNFSSKFVKDKLDGTGCFDVVGKVTFTDSNKYTCFENREGNDNKDKLLLQIHVGEIEDGISGFVVETGGADTSSIEVKDGEPKTDEVKMFSGDGDLVVPGKNEERTYVFNVANPENVKIYPILGDGQTCSMSDDIQNVLLCTG